VAAGKQSTLSTASVAAGNLPGTRVQVGDKVSTRSSGVAVALRHAQSPVKCEVFLFPFPETDPLFDVK
jgi:hypothetical protein